MSPEIWGFNRERHDFKAMLQKETQSGLGPLGEPLAQFGAVKNGFSRR